MGSPLRRLEYTIMEANEIIDELPDVPSSTQSSDTENTRHTATLLFDDIFSRLYRKGYVGEYNGVLRDQQQVSGHHEQQSDRESDREDELEPEVPGVEVCANLYYGFSI